MLEMVDKNKNGANCAQSINHIESITLLALLCSVYYSAVLKWNHIALSSIFAYAGDGHVVSSSQQHLKNDEKDSVLFLHEYLSRVSKNDTISDYDGCHGSPRDFKRISFETGGTLYAYDNKGKRKIKIEFPAHCIPCLYLDASVEVLPTHKGFHDSRTSNLACPIICLGPSGSVFKKPVKVTLPFYEKALYLNLSSSKLIIMVSQTKVGEKPKWRKLYTHYNIFKVEHEYYVTFDVPHFSVYKVLFDIGDTALPDSLKLHASNFVCGFSFRTHFEAYMTNCNNEKQFAICVVGYRESENSGKQDGKFEEYPLHVGKCKSKKIKTGKLRIKLRSELFNADVSIGESADGLMKDVEYSGHDVDVQFSCLLSKACVPDLEIFGKVIISQLDDQGNEQEEFSFNLIKKNQSSSISSNNLASSWNDVRTKELVDILSSDKCLWNKLAVTLGYTTSETRVKFGNSKEPVFDIFSDYVTQRMMDKATFFEALIQVAGYFNINSSSSSLMATSKFFTNNETIESQHVSLAKKRTFEESFSNNQHRKLEEHELDDISVEISRSWKRVGRNLNVQETSLNEIDLRTGVEEREKAFQMLLEWRERFPEEFTVGLNRITYRRSRSVTAYQPTSLYM